MKLKNRYSVLYVYSGKLRVNSGIDLVVRQQIQALTEQGYNVTLFSRGQFIHQKVKNISFRITPANLISFLPSRYYYHAQHRFFSFIAGCYLILNNFDLVIGWQQQSKFLFKVAQFKSIKKMLNCPVTHYAWGKKSSKPSIFLWPNIPNHHAEKEYRLSEKLLVASDFAKSTFLQNNISDEKLVMIGRGADTQRFNFSNDPKNKFRVIFFGRASERKGIIQAIKAWKLASIKKGEFLIVGAIPKEIRSQILKLISKNIHILGHLEKPEKILNQCSVQILPTRMEGLAKSLIEGASCGLITLTTIESGFPIIDGVNGYYINRADIDDIAQKIKYLYKHSTKREWMARESSRYIAKHLTWDLFKGRFLKSVNNILKDDKSK